jgi:hypothetical protein
MFTTFFNSSYKARALRDGASGFLLKTYAVEEIAAHIRRAQKQPAGSVVAVPGVPQESLVGCAESHFRDERTTVGEPMQPRCESAGRRTIWRGAANRLVRRISQLRALLGILH